MQEPTPWFTPASLPQFKVIVDLLEGAAPRLLAEFWDLWGSGALTADVECIHNPTRGVWRAHSVGAPWQAPGSAPVARQLVNAITAAQALPIIRAEYSALDGGGHISPHYGMTNGEGRRGQWLSFLDVVRCIGLVTFHRPSCPACALMAGQIKFHLGLVVPQRDGPGGATSAPCAFLTVDGLSRPWMQGRVLIFDDSFKHHVDNDCPSLRVVFQVVVVHPAVAAARAGRPPAPVPAPAPVPDSARRLEL